MNVDALDAKIVRFFTDSPRATKPVLRASSVIVLNTYFQGRTLNLLEAAAAASPAQ